MDECILKNQERILDHNLNIDSDASAMAISKALYDDSELLAHEAAYCLGQMQVSVLADKSLPCVVRHEAGEALAAIGDVSCLDAISEYINDPFLEVAETCQIARHRLLGVSSNKPCPDSIYGSVDPAPPMEEKSQADLEAILMAEDESLFDRYRAMFALRNMGTDSCVKALHAKVHFLAFVLGQMRNEVSVDALISVLANVSEHPMVRHESAEALGNIATPRCIEYLHTLLNDPHRIVRESCFIALDIADYQNSEAFQYVEAAS